VVRLPGGVVRWPRPPPPPPRECPRLLSRLPATHTQCCIATREMENKGRDPSGILSISSQRGWCRTSQFTRLQSTRVPTPLSHPFINCNVLHVSLYEDSQNIPCATPKRGGGGRVISLTVPYISDHHQGVCDVCNR
jgi:hypothetical protein